MKLKLITEGVNKVLKSVNTIHVSTSACLKSGINFSCETTKAPLKSEQQHHLVDGFSITIMRFYALLI